MKEFVEVLRKYAVFKGRASRSEYWMYLLVGTLINLFVVLITLFMPRPLEVFSILASVLYVVFLLPSLAVMVRRLHDTSHSGWWIFINLVPILGGIYFLYLSLQKSQPGTNQYGPNPNEKQKHSFTQLNQQNPFAS
jgi:uncharacterized membrane protein YhaH (DUF805 family)